MIIFMSGDAGGGGGFRFNTWRRISHISFILHAKCPAMHPIQHSGWPCALRGNLIPFLGPRGFNIKGGFIYNNNVYFQDCFVAVRMGLRSAIVDHWMRASCRLESIGSETAYKL